MIWETMLLGGNMHWKMALWLGVGVLIAIALNNTISGFVNPVLSPAKLSVSLNG